MGRRKEESRGSLGIRGKERNGGTGVQGGLGPDLMGGVGRGEGAGQGHLARVRSRHLGNY